MAWALCWRLVAVAFDTMDPFDAADMADTGVTDSLGVSRREVVLAGHTGDVGRARQGLGDPRADVRVAALGALDRLAALTTEDIEAALADDEPPVRRRAAELGRGCAMPTSRLRSRTSTPSWSRPPAGPQASGRLPPQCRR